MLDILDASPLAITPFILMAAFLLDLAIGDPHWLPHPVRLIGKAISQIETLLRRYVKTPLAEGFGGILLVIVITALTFIATYLITGSFIQPLNNITVFLGVIVYVYLTSTTLATRGLVKSAELVINSVKANNLDAARHDLSMIVGRDTQGLSEKGVLRATTETLAENLSDGVIAPLFYLLIGGLPLALTYKAINTLDSMVGYKNSKYRYFGWAAARLDDIVNYIPARITGLLIVVTSFFISRSASTLKSSAAIMLRDGRKHASPNSGIPEAAIAGALQIRLGGPSAYGGLLVEKPYIGDESKTDYLAASENAINIVKITACTGMVITVFILSLKAGL